MIFKNLTQHQKLLSVAYVTLLLAIVAVGAMTFRDQYQPPLHAQRILFPANQPLNEPYHDFLRFSGLGLALCLSIGAALLGVWRKSFAEGAAAFLIGHLLTFVGLAALPWVYFPYDQYAVPALWAMTALVPTTILWVVAALIGRLLMKTRLSQAKA